MKTIFKEYYNQFIGWLETVNEMRFSKACSVCGYKFDRKNPITTHPWCHERFLSMSFKRQQSLIEKYKENQVICLVCKEELTNSPNPREGVCPMCGHLQ